MILFFLVACFSSLSAAVYAQRAGGEESHDSDLQSPSADDVYAHSSAHQTGVNTANLNSGTTPHEGHVPRDAKPVNIRRMAVDADGEIASTSDSSEPTMTAHDENSGAHRGFHAVFPQHASSSDDNLRSAAPASSSHDSVLEVTAADARGESNEEPAPSTHASMLQVIATDVRVQAYEDPARSKFYHWLVDPSGRAPIVETSLLRQETWGVDDAAITRAQAARDVASHVQETMTIRQRMMENEGTIAGCVAAGIFVMLVGVFTYRRYTERRIKHRTQDLRTASPPGGAPVPKSPREKASESGTAQTETTARMDYAALRTRPTPSK